MGKSVVVCLYYSDGLEFPALGLVHCEQVNAVFGPRKNAQIFNGESVPAFTASDISHHLCG